MIEQPLGHPITCLPNITFNGRPAFAGPAVTFPLHDVHIDAVPGAKALKQANSYLLSGFPRQTAIPGALLSELPKEWWRRTGSNRRPDACKATALPAELRPLILVGLGRLERPTSPLSGVRSNHLSYRPRAGRPSDSRCITQQRLQRSRYPDEKEKRGRPIQVPPIEALTGLHVSNDAARGANS